MPAAAKENRSESDDPKSQLSPPASPPPAAAEPEPVPNGRFGANRRLRKRRSGSLSPMKADGTPRPASQEDLTRPASSPELANAPAPAAETTPARPPSKFDSGNFSFHKSPEPEAPPPPPSLARREFGAEHEVTARLAADLTRALYLAGASADDLLEAEALRRESLTGSEAVLDASHEEYVRREELVAAAREVGWEPFSCEEIRAVTLER